MRLFALCNKYFQWRAFFSRNYPQNQDVSPPPRPFLPELRRFPGHFLLRRQFLHDLPAKSGCFPTAPQFPPGFVAFSGTFSSVATVSPCFTPKTRMFSTAPQFPPCFVVFSGTFSSAAAVSPCFAPKTRMFPYRPTIFSMFCGVFRDIFLRGGSSSTFYPQNQDVSLPPHNFLHVLWRFPGHFPPRWQFLHD